MTQAKLLNDSDYIYEEVEIEQVQQLLNDGYDVEVDSPEGYTKVLRYVEKGTKWMFDIKCNNKDIHASYDHLFETQEGWVLTHELDSSKHNILCDDGKFHSFTIEDTGNMNEVVDIEVLNPKHRYYTNGLSSHNTNIGKTLMLCSMAASMLLAGKKVLYLSFEIQCPLLFNPQSLAIEKYGLIKILNTFVAFAPSYAVIPHWSPVPFSTTALL